MNRKRNCWDNAVTESFFSSQKKERIKKHIYRTRELAIADVTDQIDTFCNQTRRHSHLGGMSPDQFEAAQEQKRRGVHCTLGTPLYGHPLGLKPLQFIGHAPQHLLRMLEMNHRQPR
jgi:hypothetical protein